MTKHGAGFVRAEQNGKQISPEGSNYDGRSTGVAELSSHEDIREADLNPEEDLVIELSESGSTIRERKEDEHCVKLEVDSLANSRLSKFFSAEEIAELQEKEQTVKGESKPKDIDEVWEGLKKDCERHNQAVRERKKQEEIEKLKEFRKKGTKYDTPVKELSGEQFQDLISEADNSSDTESEELQEQIQKIEEKWSRSETDTPSTPNEEVEELAANSFKEYGGAFGDIARDIEKSSQVPDTEITTLSDGSTMIVTSYDDLKIELREMDNNPSKGTKIKDESGDTINAIVPEGERYD